MSNGGYKGATPPRETSPEHYPGVWGLPEQYQAQADGNWPFQEDDCAPKSLSFNGSNNYLSRTPSSVGNRKTWTISCWVKRGGLNASSSYAIFGAYKDGNKRDFIGFEDNQVRMQFRIAGTFKIVETVAKLRDPSAWAHYQFVWDTTQPLETDRAVIYINGQRQQVTTAGHSYPALNDSSRINNNDIQYIGATSTSGAPTFHYDGGIAELFFIDGQALTPDAFTFIDGQGILQPKRFTGDYASGPVYSGQSILNTTSGSVNAAPIFDGDVSTFTRPVSSNNSYYGANANDYIFRLSDISFSGASELKLKLRGNSEGYNYIWFNDDISTKQTLTLGNGSAAVLTVTGLPSTITAISLAGPDTGSGNFGLSIYYIQIDAQIIQDASVGANSFHLDFSDVSDSDGPGKDSSGLGNHFPVLVTGSGPYEGLRVAGPQQPWNSGTAIAITSGNNHNTSGNQRGLRFDSELLGTHTLTLTKVSGSHNMDFFESSNPTSQGSRVTNSSNTIVISSNSSSRSPAYTGRYLSIEGTGGGYVTFSVSGTANSTSTQLSNVLVDVPVNGTEASTGVGNERRGNYCVMNPLDHNGCTISNSNLVITPSSSNCGRGTVWATSGKWYFEFEMTAYGNPYVGIASTGHLQHYVSQNSIAINNTGTIYVSTGGSQTYPGNSIQIDAVGSYMCAFDLDNGKIWWGKAGTWYQLDSTSNQTTTKSNVEAGNGAVDFSSHPNFGKAWTVQFGTSSNSSTFTVNTGQSTFKYPSSIPAGFSPLATSFLPEPTIADGSEYFGAKLFVGNGATQSITMDNSALSPDFVWIKQRNNNGAHMLFDSVRGATKRLVGNQNLLEGTVQGVTSFDSTGFGLGNDPDCNMNTINHVAWVWDAGEATTTVAAGSLNSSAYDQSQTWSSNSSGLNNPSHLFENDSSNATHVASASSSGDITFSSALTNVTKLEVKFAANTGAGHFIRINGQNIANASGSGVNTFFDLTSALGGTTFSSIGATSGASGGPELWSVRVNGKLLVDSGVSVTNVPSIASTVRALPEAGFSIGKFTGTGSTGTVSTGLSNTKVVILKNRDSASDWVVYHTLVDGSYDYWYLNLTNQSLSSSLTHDMNNTFKVGSNTDTNATGDDYLFYAFSPVEGYSAMGTYSGAFSSGGSGPFVWCGFRPAFILVKKHDGGDGGVMWDTARAPFNAALTQIRTHESSAESAEYSSFAFDILSNGFRPVGASGQVNGHGSNFIFIAFAEHPFVSQARAR